ncbi:MAG: hypothetical protein AAGD25_27730 [Cyanobacteria bacterium P01_F01_bin.150]
MAQITINVPDDLARRLEPLQGQLPALFTQFVERAIFPPPAESALQMAQSPTTCQEVLDFLISRPTPQDILNFRVSEQSQSRLQELLQKNRNTDLSNEDRAELDLYEQLDSLMGLLKVNAYDAVTEKGA